MKSPSIVKNYIYDTLYHAATFLIPLITTPYLARVLLPTGTGIFSYTLSIQTYFSMFAALGTTTYGSFIIAQSRDDRKKLSENFWGIETLTILTSAVVIFFWLLLVLFNKEYQIYFLILTINILATTFDITWFFSGLELFKILSLRNTFFKILGAALIFIFVNSENDLGWYFVIYAGTALISNLSLWPLLRHNIDFVPLKTLRLRNHFKETIIYFVPTIATSVYTVLDKTLIGIIVNGSEENGFYEQASQIINIVKTITFGSINTVLGARLSYLFYKGNVEEMKQKMYYALDFMFLLGFGMIFGLIAVAKDFVLVYLGSGYEKVEILLYLLAPVVIIISISSCLGTQYYIPVGKRLISAKYLICGSVINLVLNIVLIPVLKSVGACLATFVAESFITLLYILGCDSFITFRDIYNKCAKKFLSGFLMLVALKIGNTIFLISNIYIKLLVDIGFGVIVYFGLLYFLKDSGMNLVLNIIKRFLAREE